MKSTSEIARELAGEHYYCDDSWYSCPKHPDGCANDSLTECNCGLENKIEKIAQAITTERQRQEMLVEALEKYGTHLSDCTTTPGDWCSCGLRKAQQVLKEVK